VEEAEEEEQQAEVAADAEEEARADAEVAADAEEEARADAELAASQAADPMSAGVEVGGPSSSGGTIRYDSY
jgi:membrane protein involved in colicin uptake